MKPSPNSKVEPYRITHGRLASDASFGNNGAFEIPGPEHGKHLQIIASDGAGWEHVSVSTKNRIPTWDEMCFVKSLFWDDEECVIEYHPPRSRYVNNHPYVLHLWKPIGIALPMPPENLIGSKRLGMLLPGK